MGCWFFCITLISYQFLVASSSGLFIQTTLLNIVTEHHLLITNTDSAIYKLETGNWKPAT